MSEHPTTEQPAPPPQTRLPAFEQAALRDRTQNLVIAGWVLSVLIPFIGFLIGYALVFKGRHGHGVAQMVFVTLFVVAAFYAGLEEWDNWFEDDSIDFDSITDESGDPPGAGSPLDDQTAEDYDECMADPSTTLEDCQELLP